MSIPTPRESSRPTRSAAAAAIAGALALASVVGGAAPAWAAARVTVAGPEGGAVLSPDHATEVTVSGSGFQTVQNGFGGVYVLFGWVDDAEGGSWRPSQGGTAGSDYRYVPDAESADNAGYQRFLAFPGSQTASSANGVLAADGSWSATMVVPGATFDSHDRDGNVTEVDCRQVTCGIITIGAHGVDNANNETFTAVSFAAVAVAGTPGASADASPTPPAAPGAVRVGVESTTVAAGTAIVFTGQGFTPGEQVMASLDGGLSAVGPLTAGAQGEVAGALPVPSTVRDGTHLVALRGAASGAVAEVELAVTGGAVAVTAAPPAETPPWVIVVLLASIVLALVLIAASLVAAVLRSRRRRAARRAAAASAPLVTAPLPAAGPRADTATGLVR